MKRLRVSRVAQKDLSEIWYYFAERSGNGELADRLIQGLLDKFDTLIPNPLIGAGREQIDRGLRVLPSGTYNIYYRVNRNTVVILRVLHGKRDQFTAYHQSG